MPARFREPNRARWVGTRPGHDGDNIDVKMSATNATVVGYTVPAGKVLMLCECSLMAIPMAVGHSYIRWDTGAGALVRYLASINAMTAVGANIMDHANFWPPIEITAGDTITINSNAAGITGYGAIHGWLEKA